MKNIVIPLCLLFFSISSFSQTNEDYTKALDEISKAFNEKNTSLIYQNFKTTLKTEISEKKLQENFEILHKNQGAFLGYELIMADETGNSFLVEFENNSMLLLIHLSADKKITKFTIKEY